MTEEHFTYYCDFSAVGIAVDMYCTLFGWNFTCEPLGDRCRITWTYTPRKLKGLKGIIGDS